MVPISGGVEDVAVAVDVAVCEAVAVAVAVSVDVIVGVAVEVDVDPGEVEEGVNVGVSLIGGGGGFVLVGFRFGVEEGVEGMNTKVLVGLVVITTVEVAEEIIVEAGDDVGVVACDVGNGVPVMTDTPGVRKSTQPGCVKMVSSTGSINPLGRRVR